MNIEILYEDEDILVINKPAGLVVHPDGRTKEDSVSEWFAKKYPEAKDVGEPIILTSPDLRPPSPSPRRGAGGEVGRIERPGIVHRIDRDTSGVLLLAKTAKGHAHLKKQFQNREIEKIYHAFVYGALKDDRGTINLSIARSTGDFRKWSAQKGSRGEKREAITYYQVLKRTPEATFVEARPKTGRTHQIRVHFQAIHHPILGDKLYGPKIAPRNLGEVGQIFHRLALHAHKITFKNLKNEEITVEAPYPEDFQKALKTLGL